MTLCSDLDPPWLLAARACIGLKEDLGPNDSTWLRRMWAHFGASWLNKQPWCGGAMAYWMCQAMVQYPKEYYRAKAWLDWGIWLDKPVVGAVVIFERDGGGHVAIVEGVNAAGQLVCVGGNQSDAVRTAPFDIKARKPLGYRWPTEYGELLALVKGDTLPVLAINDGVSRNEA
jgi:uncharacterized protein (TIGR02594 family)